jgi:hypothetical protein
MGDKKKRKRIKKLMAKGDGVVWDDLVLAGIGTLAEAAKKRKKKVFDKAVERGIRTLDLEIPELDDLVYDDTDDAGSDPVISYSPHGGGWYNIEIDAVIVERIKGEEEAANRAGELLESFAALDPEEQDNVETGVFHSGGGWYRLVVNGVPVGKVQGEEAANERYAEIEAFNVETTVDA